ncbi:MAG: sulfite exporter TauE/SafE family protein [Lentisphaerae bacterium]|nr:sulfite exporter TauE/SafE family protein [Lentisphaerota bacterium]
MTLWLAYLAIGSIAGLLAGLLGVGGGLIIVPLLAFAFTTHGLPAEHVQRLALGTSLATIVFTATSSGLAHHRHGAVRWDAVARLAAGIVVGTFGGSWVAARLSPASLKGFFAAFLLYVSIQMLLDMRPRPTRQLPGAVGMSAVGGGIGLISSLVGIGGGTMSVPFLVWCNLPVRTAIGTSAAIGFPIALSGAAGYIVNGWHAPALPPGCLGFVYLPALTGVAAASVLTAPLGARLAHRVPTRPLKRGFALFLLAVAARMIA